MNVLSKLVMKNIKLNKKRSIVTIIGIMLSVALICAVGVMITSYRKTLVEHAIKETGYYHVEVNVGRRVSKDNNEISKSGDKVIIQCEENNIFSQIKIKNFGNVIDEEDRANIFKRFYKGKNAKKDSVGIGLALAKSIIENDNGRITVESKEGDGTEFVIKYFRM